MGIHTHTHTHTHTHRCMAQKINKIHTQTHTHTWNIYAHTKNIHAYPHTHWEHKCTHRNTSTQSPTHTEPHTHRDPHTQRPTHTYVECEGPASAGQKVLDYRSGAVQRAACSYLYFTADYAGPLKGPFNCPGDGALKKPGGFFFLQVFY